MIKVTKQIQPVDMFPMTFHVETVVQSNVLICCLPRLNYHLFK